MPLLVIQNGKHKGTRLVLPKRHVTIGRDEHCGIRLNSSDVSRQHCRLFRNDATYCVEDLGSQNGTFVNDAPVEGRVPLQHGDRLRVGPMEFVFTIEKPQKKDADTKKPPRKKGQTVTADEIANWLADESGANSADSTVILPRSAPPTSLPETAHPEAEESSAEAEAGPSAEDSGRKGFASVAEEGADIIRRYLEKVGQSPPEDS